MRYYRRLLQRLGHTRWLAAAFPRVVAPVDKAVLKATRGRLSITGPPVVPTLLLTTVGRRSGQARTTPLMYVRDGDRLVVSSEDWGQQRPTAWPANLRANPQAAVQIRARTARYRARPASEAEAERYWPELRRLWPAVETYRERSGKRRMFVLEPDDAPESLPELVDAQRRR
jgi:deazaflavin-dependent oxidoreductase (nitroreductase family)